MMWGSFPMMDGLLPTSILQGFVDASGLEAASEEEWTSKKQRQLLTATLDPGRPAAWGLHGMHRWIGQESCCDCSARVTALLYDAAEPGPDVQSEEITR